jgi:glycosyltransferase involved in cell wall biosynthesis
VRDCVVQLPRQDQRTVASLYRQAAAVLMPSEAEGFGLPVIEALACGSPVIASDIAVFREVGGDEAIYARLADLGDWAAAVEKVLADPRSSTQREGRTRHAARFSWRVHADTIAAAYARL